MKIDEQYFLLSGVLIKLVFLVMKINQFMCYTDIVNEIYKTIDGA